MIRLDGGSFRMGSRDFYPEEQPVRAVEVDPFWIDEHPVTVAQFRRFVKETGYVTHAEREPDPADYPDSDPALLMPGSLVFHATSDPVSLDDYSAWWHWIPGAMWSRPEGPASDVYTRGLHPVVQVTHDDAAAYAGWTGKQLPTEAEWEYAARGGLDGAVFAWGNEFMPDGRLMANTWHGEFPYQHDRPDQWLRTSPVMSYPPNGYGLYDITGNVWEWTDDFYSTGCAAERPCCTPRNPRTPEPVAESFGLAGEPGGHIPRRVTKGGSHLCAPNYCLRYRPAARQGEAVDTSTGHIGFRCVRRPA
jgi:formylglycine-generating enzyme required for sulfatase activity